MKWSLKLWGYWLGLMITLCLGSCMVGPDYKRPRMSVPTNYVSDFHHKTVSVDTSMGDAQEFLAHQEITAQWWTLFRSKDLNELVLAGFRHSPQIHAARFAVRNALENAYVQRSLLYPFLDASFTPSLQQTAAVLQSNLASNGYLYGLYTGQLYLSYTADVFGGIRRGLESLKALARLQRLELEAAYVSLSANIINAAIQEASIQAQIAITQQIINTQKEVLSIYQKRMKLGDASLANIAEQEALLGVVESSLPVLQQQLATQVHLLNALIGRFPEDKRTPKFTFKALHLPTRLPISVPSELLEHRPDIRAAEEQMHSASALVGVAISNRLPHVNLGVANVGQIATDLGSFFTPDSNFFGLSGVITQPVLHANSLIHQQRAAEAQYRQMVSLYRSTIINAFQNVADVLKQVHYDALALEATNNAEKAALKSWTIVRQQLLLGDATIIDFLFNERIYRQAELNLIQAQTNRLTDTVALFQALGGGWWNKCPGESSSKPHCWWVYTPRV